MKFAEFHPGQRIEAGPYILGAAELHSFAAAYDPQWFHINSAAAAEGPFGGIIASGWHTCAVAMRLVADRVLAGSESFASPGLKYVKWPHPVRAGDALSLCADVVAVRRSQKKPELGILDWRWRLLNQDGVEVLDLQATSLFRLLVE